MKIYIIRHGETDYNLEHRIQGQFDSPLNETGEKQARELTDKLKQREITFDAVFTSDLQRARRTAEIICDRMDNPPLAIEPGLRERFMGEVEGMLHADAKRKARMEGKPGLLAYGESAKEVEDRLRLFWDDLMKRCEADGHKTVGLVSHGGALTRLIHHLHTSGKVKYGRLNKTTLGKRLGNCAIVIIEDNTFIAYGEQLTASIDREADLL